jgi:hypothetical protein
MWTSLVLWLRKQKLHETLLGTRQMRSWPSTTSFAKQDISTCVGHQLASVGFFFFNIKKNKYALF